MTVPSSASPISIVLDIHTMIVGFIVAAVEDIPESRMTDQPGGIVNHPAWTLSHLNAYAAALLVMLEDPSVNPLTADEEMARFGYGTVPVREPAAYAPKRALLERFQDRTARLSSVVAEKHAEVFPMPAPEKYQPHSPTMGHIAITLLIAHPPHHLGQLRQWRRAAGFSDAL